MAPGAPRRRGQAVSAKTVGVLGAGVMGTGVAQALAQTGHRVLLVDCAEPALRAAEKTLARQVRLRGLFAKATSADPADAILARIELSTDDAVCRGADFVIENVTERWPVKEALYRRLDGLCAPRCIFASNTSAIPITRLASATRRPDRVIGTHFMNPVPLKAAVEVVRGHHTSDETVAETLALLAAMGKEALVVGDGPGFVSNRVLMLAINEAIFLVQEQTAPPAEIDRIFKKCLGHAMGPLETADLIGLDTILDSIEVLRESFGDSKYRPCPLLRRMVVAGLLGRKSGQGFFTYPSAE